VQRKPKYHPGAHFAGGSVVRNCGSVPALANAVFDALKPVNLRKLKMPYTPCSIRRAICDARDST
jgi:hypothetical protein